MIPNKAMAARRFPNGFSPPLYEEFLGESIYEIYDANLGT
jgi:hypothetical protein